MQIREIIKEEYEIIKEIYMGNSIEKLWNELEICQEHIIKGTDLGYDVSDILKESLVVSDLIRQKSEKCKKNFLKKLRDRAWKSETDEEFDYRLTAMNFFGEEYIHRTYY